MKIKLNLGCGNRKKIDYINIDNRLSVSPDMLVDVTDGLPFSDNSVDEIEAYDFLEHIPIGKTVFVIEEIYRVLKNGGTLKHFTPSSEGRGAFQDPTHVSFWNINSWIYYMDDAHRELYNIKAKFEGRNQDVVSNPDLKIIHTMGFLKAVK